MLPAAAIAAVMVTVVAGIAYLVSPNGSGASGLSTAIQNLSNNKAVAALEAERQQIIVMNAAAGTMTSAAKPTVVSPADIQEASGAASSDSGGGSQTSVDATPVATPDPGTAQSIAYKMMSSFGFSPSSQWSCLDQTWQKESGWSVIAENPSGAYGIPQSLPASKMASAGPDYMSDAATQIRWGLGYIQSTYGTPCDAWAHEVNDGWY